MRWFFLTNLSVAGYLSFDLIKYMIANLSFLNLIHPELPGVFENNYIQGVNGALWTIRFEVLFYMFIPVAGTILSKYNKKYVCLLVLLYPVSRSGTG